MVSSGAYCEDSIEDEVVLQGSSYAGPHRESACSSEALSTLICFELSNDAARAVQ